MYCFVRNRQSLYPECLKWKVVVVGADQEPCFAIFAVFQVPGSQGCLTPLKHSLMHKREIQESYDFYSAAERMTSGCEAPQSIFK